MRKLNKLCASLLFIIVCALCFLFPACTNDNQGTTLTFSKNSVTVEVDATVNLSVVYDGDQELVWTIEDDSICSLKDTVVTGKKAGSTTITVKAGDLLAKCIVTVIEPVDGGQEETESYLNVAGGNRVIYVGDQIVLEPVVYTNDKETDWSDFTYAVSDDTVVSVETNGTVTAKAIGSTSVTVSATVNGVKLSVAVRIDVKANANVEILQDSITLYPYAQYNGTNYKNTDIITLKVIEKEQEIVEPNVTFTVEEGQDIIDLNAQTGEITGKNAGNTKVTAVYTTANGESVRDEIIVLVNPVDAVLDKTLTVALNETSNGYEIDVEEMVQDETVTFTNAYLNKEDTQYPISVNDNVLDLDIGCLGTNQLVLTGRNVSWKLTIDVWSAFIDNAEDLISLQQATNGRYKLNQNIDASGISWAEAASQYIFTGLLDGCGFNISGLTITGECGLFTGIGGNAVVKNISFIDTCISSNATAVGAIAATCDGGVSIENVKVEMANAGTECGGLFGEVLGTAKINVSNVNAYVYSVDKNSSSGILFGSCAGMVTLTDCGIYGTGQICGNDSLLNDSYTASNPEKLEDTNIKAVERGAVSFTLEFDADKIDSIAVYGNGIRKCDINSVVALEYTDVANLDGNGVEIVIKMKDGSYTSYRSELYIEIEISQNNIQELLNLTKERVLLVEDIDMAGLAWNPNNAYTGIFNGDGYTIKNFTTKASSGFFKTFAGTMKNVSFANVKLLSQAGVIAYNMPNNSTGYLENVYVQVNHRVAEWGSNLEYTGLIGRAFQTSAILNMNNCVVVMPTSELENCGYVFGFGGHANLNNCYFVGGNGQVNGNRSGYQSVVKGEADENYSVYNTVSEMLTAASNDNALSAAMKADLIASNTWIEVTQENVMTTLMTATDGMYKLTENIDLTGITWNHANTFIGVLDGNEKTISNLKTFNNGKGGADNISGLFYTFKGTIKNLALTNVTYKSQTGVIAYRTEYSTLENVFVQVNSYERIWATVEETDIGLYGAKVGTDTIHLKNVAVVMDKPNITGTRYGYVLGFGKGYTALDNCYFAGLDQINGVRSGYDIAVIGEENVDYLNYETSNAMYSAFNDGTATSTAFIKACVLSALSV